MHSLHRVSAVAFYLLGAAVILGIVLVSRGILSAPLSTALHILDLPLLASAMLYGGSSLIVSLPGERSSAGLAVAVFGLLGILLLAFAYFNFALPFAPIF